MMPGTLGMVFKSVFLLLAFFLISVTIYSFALTARYENTIGATLKNALLLTVAKLPYTILMTALTVGAVVLSWWNTGILMLTIPVWILAGTGILAFINSCILRRVFRVFDEKAERRRRRRKNRYGRIRWKNNLHRQENERSRR